MTIAEMLKRLQEIKARNAEIVAESRKQGIAPEKIKALAEEQEKILTERSELELKLIEARNEIGSADFSPFIGDNTPADSDAIDLRKLSGREKIAYMTGKALRGKALTAAEKRALGKAVTTTAVEYVAATADTDGENNAGVFISTKQLFDILREEGKLSPILADIAFTHVKGLIDFPYRKSRTKANVKIEKQGTAENQMEWDTLTGVKGWLQTVMVITDEVLALTDFDLGTYIVEQMLQDLEEDWCADLIYGPGDNHRIKGITYGAAAAVTGGYTGSAADALIAGIKACTGKFRRGAKAYVAQDVYDDILFAQDDNGNFKYPVINNTQGIVSIGPLRIELDENLHEGDFIVGNVTKYYKANLLRGLKIEPERSVVKGLTTYVASEFCAAVPVPGAFIYGVKKNG